MQPFTFDQSLIAGALFVLGLLIGMFLLAGSKWKRRYRDEVARREALEAENETLRRDAREMESLRHAAAKSPAQVASHTETQHHETGRVTEVQTEPYRRVVTTSDDRPDTVIRRT